MKPQYSLSMLLVFALLCASQSEAGTALAALSRSPTPNCSTATVGTSVSCGTLIVTATSGTGSPVTLANPYYTVTGSPGEYVLTLDTSASRCQTGQVMSPGNTCIIGALEFRPTTTGTGKQYHIVVKTTVVPTSGFSSMDFFGAGYTYSWQAGGWPGCTGGTGTWSYSGWSPTSGCGNVTQTRSASCNADAMSATQSRSVTCVRNDSVVSADTFCNAGTRPASSQSCTPTSGYSCGAQAPLSQTVLLTNTCSYSWSAGAWSASSSTCSASATQTRTVSCLRSDGTTVADPNCNAGTKPSSTQTVSDFSGCSYSWSTGAWSASSSTCSSSATQTRTVSCLRSDGTTVADASCNAGTKPSGTQTVSDFSGCSYSWQSGGWSGCTGGTGTWNYSSWSPTSGCGTTSQTRTASCLADAGSALQSRTVTCLRSDGTPVSDSLCAGAKPASNQSCTPTSGFSCGTQGALSQSTLLTNSCSYDWVAGTWSASSDTCSANATQTRAVSCRRSDGTTVPDASCNASTRPAASQTISDFSGCSYSWQLGGWNACTGGTGTWSYTAWSPASGCGSTSQTRSASCLADAGSATQSRSVACLRSDGTIVSDASCTASKPAALQACTPLSGFSCGVAASTSRALELTDTCTYSWVASGFGACAGGTATWIIGEWMPESGCGPTMQTRSLSCSVDALSGSQSQTVSCLRSDGSTAPDLACDAGARPLATQSCTPSSADCGAAPSANRSQLLTNACPSATASPYRGCTPDPANGKYCIFTPL